VLLLLPAIFSQPRKKGKEKENTLTTPTLNPPNSSSTQQELLLLQIANKQAR
jgi:hypothetical protein